MIYAGASTLAIFLSSVSVARLAPGKSLQLASFNMDAAVNLKFYVPKNGQAVLRSANPGYADIPFTENHAVVGVMTGLTRDGAPVLNDYERLLITTETINQKWTSAVNEAIADGISPEQFLAMLGLIKNFYLKS